MDCCNKSSQKKGIFSGILYGLIPHIGCIGFIVFSILGVTAATAIFRPFLLNPYFFHILIVISFVFATISAIIYLKKNTILSFLGIKRKWKYLLTLYGTTIGINLLLFMLIFPVLATLDVEDGLSLAAISRVFIGAENDIESLLSSATLQVAIPCPGHAPLITGELKTIQGVEKISYRFPNKFIVNYNPEETSKQEIVSLDVFKTYKAEIITNEK
ncbi:MAG: hypothetical protein KY053_02125 [Candidatus Liptonbacteria bacterium]|nr:hypothetical protein [Candidatus Liptonbacteria bacterium]